MFLHVRGFGNGGFCFMNGDKPVSVVEALQQNKKTFNKRTLDALKRENLANVNGLKVFEQQVEVLHKGLSAEYIIAILRNEHNIDFSLDFHALSSADIDSLLETYKIARYRVPGPKVRNGSPMRYFYQYLQRFVDKKN